VWNDKEIEMQIAIEVLTTVLVRLVRLRGSSARSSERGDVPGWVMITVMTAGLVAALWAVAGPELERMLRDALSSVA
jgi:hypothetical protein